MRSADLLTRAALVVVALLAVLLGAPAPLAGALALLALLAAGQRLVRARRRGALDAALLLVGGLTVTLVLVGLVVGLTPAGLTARSWALGLLVVAAATLALSVRTATPKVAWSRGGVLAVVRTAPWVALALAVVVVATTMSVRSVDSSDDPPLQMSLGTVRGDDVAVVVSASTRTGPLEVRTELGGGSEVSYPLFTVRPGHRVTQTVSLPTTGRYTITLNYVNQTEPLRTLILDR